MIAIIIIINVVEIIYKSIIMLRCKIKPIMSFDLNDKGN